MNIDSLKSQEDLKAYLHEQQDKIATLEKTIEKAQTEAWTREYSGSDHGLNEKALDSLGRLCKAMLRGDQIEVLKWTEANKVNLGTPLYSDSGQGASLVTPEISANIQWVAYQSSQLINRVSHTPMNTLQKLVPVGATLPVLTCNATEATASTESDPTFVQKSLKAFSTATFIPVTESMLEDSTADLAMYITQTVGSYLGYWLDFYICQGSTTPWNGILNDSTYNVTMSQGKVNLTDPTYDDLVSMLNAITTERYRKNGVYCFAPTTVAALRTKKNAMGDYLLREGVSSGSPPTFLGYEVISCDGMAQTSAPGIKCGWFGNPAYFLIGDRVPMEIKKLDATQNAVNYETVYFRARARYGGAVTINAGFCTLTTAGS